MIHNLKVVKWFYSYVLFIPELLIISCHRKVSEKKNPEHWLNAYTDIWLGPISIGSKYLTTHEKCNEQCMEIVSKEVEQ